MTGRELVEHMRKDHGSVAITPNSEREEIAQAHHISHVELGVAASHSHPAKSRAEQAWEEGATRLTRQRLLHGPIERPFPSYGAEAGVDEDQVQKRKAANEAD